MVAWAAVMTLAMEVVCDLVRRAIGPGSVALYTLIGGWSTVFVTLSMVCLAMGSSFSWVDVTLGADGAALGVGMNTLGSETRVWTGA